MKKVTTALLLCAATLMLFVFYPKAEATAAVHTVKTGDTFWKIANQYGVTVQQIKAANGKTSDLLYPGQKLYIPHQAISESDKDLMARLVSAEAKGEPYAGKVAVATVILNRLSSPEFPNSIKEIIYQVDGGHYAFTPVKNGMIHQAADAESIRAVNEALDFWG